MCTELCVGVFGIQFCALYLNKYGMSAMQCCQMVVT